MKVFDVFISYRRVDSEIAERLYEELHHSGFVVFWDKESLENGLFGDDIRTAIRNCEHFLLLMNDDTLDRCFNDSEDWIMQEVSEAISKKKNIIPLFIGSTSRFPEQLPDKIKSLGAYNGIPEFDCDDDNSMKQLVTKFLKNGDVYSQDDYFEINGDTLTRCTHPTLKVMIPSGVRVIGKEAFADCTMIQEVHFDTELEEIGESAFQRCRNLEYIDLPPHLKSVRKKAFYRCHHLKAINLSESIEEIEEQAFAFCNSVREVRLDKKLCNIDVTAFEECTKLKTIVIDPSNQLYSSGDGVLFNKDKTSLLKFPAAKQGTYKVPVSVKKIGKYAFANSSISKIVFTSELMEIEKYAFLDSSVKIIEYPFSAHMTTVDRLSFSGCDSLAENPFEIIREDSNEDTNIKERLVLYEYVIVKTSFESEEEAYNMIKMLLERELIVSGQIKEHRAVYKWDGGISDEKEIELLCFTRGILYNKVEEYILEHHSYDCPEILCIPIINTSVAFGKWINEGTRCGERK